MIKISVKTLLVSCDDFLVLEIVGDALENVAEGGGGALVKMFLTSEDGDEAFLPTDVAEIVTVMSTEDVENGGLALAVTTNECDLFPILNMEAEIGKKGFGPDLFREVSGIN